VDNGTGKDPVFVGTELKFITEASAKTSRVGSAQHNEENVEERKERRRRRKLSARFAAFEESLALSRSQSISFFFSFSCVRAIGDDYFLRDLSSVYKTFNYLRLSSRND
jgi:hypothetical protein